MSGGKLRWQCKRGMRELDELLARYLDGAYLQAPASEKTAFHELLRVADPDLIGYLLGSQKHANADIADVIETIRSRPQA
jgi:antitoxin CptB